MATEHPDNGQYEDFAAYGLEVNFRAYGGGGIFTRGTGGAAKTVSFPTWADGAGIFDDVVQAVCGYGTLAPISTAYGNAWVALGGLAGTLTLTMIGDGASGGHLLLTGDESFKVKVEGTAGQNTAWGFDAGESNAVLSGGKWLVTASTRPRWGNVDLAPVIETASGDIDLGAMRHHSPFVALVSAAGGQHIEDLDNTEVGVTSIRWFVTIDGRVGWAAPTGVADAIESWSSRAVRQLLGWTGRETVTTAGGLDYQIGDRPCLRFWRPSRPVQAQPFMIDLPGDAQRLDDLSIASNVNGTFELDEWPAFLDGPADQVQTWGSGDYARAIPDYDRVIGGFLRYASRGAKVSCWQAWPEHRAYQNHVEVDVDTDAYTGQITSSGRYIGRVDSRIAVSASETTNLRYAAMMRRSLPVTLYTQRRT